jgi:hypothetical protein
MALFGAIDEVVRNTDDLEIVETVESFLPGLTGIGKRGWFGELKQFLATPALAPRRAQRSKGRRSAQAFFPSVDAAVNELVVPRSEPPPPGAPPSPDSQSPTDVARTLFASTVLSKILDVVKDKQQPAPRALDFPGGIDPLGELLVRHVELPSGSGSIPGMDPISGEDELVPAVRQYLAGAPDRDEFQVRLQVLANSGVVAQAVADAQPLCTGGLRKINGQFCSVLTTDYKRTDLTVADIKKVIEPHNWPTLCPDFFQRMEDQKPLSNRGWTRVLEVVSADPNLWELRTALRYWKGETTPDGGFYINYDLDKDRTGDCMAVEVDAGYLMITPLDPKNAAAGVRIRTCKQVRIRGMSSTASAALACFFGWGDVSSHMLTDQAKPPFAGAIDFGTVSKDPGKKTGTATQTASLANTGPTDAEIELAAEQAELPTGWRGALIKGFQQETKEAIDVATVGASQLLKRWSDGLTAKDVEEFGAQFGASVTKFAAGLLNAASNATSPPTKTDTNGGT